MLKSVQVRLARFLLPTAISLSVVAATMPVASAELTPYQVAQEVVIGDIASAMLTASAYSGGGMITTSNGTTSISPDGTQFTMSFTAGGVQYSDMGIFTPDNVAPGTGTWSITTTGGSTYAVTGAQIVSYDSATDVYSGDIDPTFPKMIHPIWGPVNDFEGAWTYDPKTKISTYIGWWTYNKAIVSLPTAGIDYNPKPNQPLPVIEIWSLFLAGTGGGDTVSANGNWTEGTFTASASAIPEPSSALLAAVGAVGAMTIAGAQKRRAKTCRATDGESGPNE